MACLLVTLRLGLHDLLSHRRLVLMMALSIAIATAMLAIVEAYRLGLAAEFKEQSPDLLQVHEIDTSGEFYGSRISAQVGQSLSGMGIPMIIPEIYAVTGTSIQSATLLRGIDLAGYTRLETFSILSGRSLHPGDPSRLAMLGVRLAESRHLRSGETISLRGRDFTIAGIFQNGTYMDNQAWISLADAQALLGWGQDVSAYVIPDDGNLHDGEVLPGGVSVSRKGESVRFFAAQYRLPMLLLGDVALALLISATLTLTSILWRLAWARRREMAILRTTGFPTFSLVGYLMTQAVGISLLGVLLGGLFALVFLVTVHLTVSGFTIVPSLSASLLLPSLGWIVLLMLAGSYLPTWWLSRLNLAQLLRSE
jgi:ABC-type lipoprotein release transport system permease subunit